MLHDLQTTIHFLKTATSPVFHQHITADPFHFALDLFNFPSLISNIWRLYWK